jgi:hypothetical protein
MRPGSTTVSALAVLALGCTSPTDPFQVTARVGSLRLANATEKAVYYVLIESETATLVDLLPCTTPSTCLHVEPRAAKTVPYPEIMGYEPGDPEAILYWWHLQPAPAGGFQPDSIRARRVRLGPGA